MRVSIIGGSAVDTETYERARELGRQLGEGGHEVVCGGRGGVMEAVCRGARETGGHTVGILPGASRAGANDYVETVVATGIGNARNPIVVMNGDVVVAVDGGPGTLSELGHALDFGRPVVGLDTYRIKGVEGIEHVETVADAVAFVEAHG